MSKMADSDQTKDMLHEKLDQRWVAIQKKTFVNWCNEQLSVGGRSVEDLNTDFCDGVKLVALIESLQFRKIGRVYSKPTSRIQMLQNAALALQAITDDHIRLVNIGPDDIVNGNSKLTLGLLWHLIVRYQISAKTKAPPKKLMLLWFQAALEGMSLTNFTTDWSDGIALSALVEYCKPGTFPDWRQLHPQNRVENCRRAMQLAKEHLNVPRVITADDFASKELDELSAMTYLSYFIRKDSPGYFATLNWVCRQLRTTNISNLTTDWNDGYYLCAIVQSLGGTVPGWPNLDRTDKLGNCQKGLEAARGLGVEPIITATELSDSHVDHLAIMAFLSKFTHVTPPKPNPQKLTLNCNLQDVKQNTETRFFVTAVDKNVNKSKVKVRLKGPEGEVRCSLVWTGNKAECKFSLSSVGKYTVHVTYEEEDVVGSPATFTVSRDISKVKVLTSSGQCRVGSDFTIEVDSSGAQGGEFRVEARSDTGQLQILTTRKEGGTVTSPFTPHNTGTWTVHVYLDGEEVDKAVTVSAYDPSKASLTVPTSGVVGEEVQCSVICQGGANDDVTAEVEDSAGHVTRVVTMTTQNGIKQFHFKPSRAGTYKIKAFLRGEPIQGSPRSVNVFDPGEVKGFGDGLRKGVKGEEAVFVVEGVENGEDITASVEAHGKEIHARRFSLDGNSCEFRYVPHRAGLYVIKIHWRGRHIKGVLRPVDYKEPSQDDTLSIFTALMDLGSPFQARVTDRGLVTILDDLDELRDDRDHIVLPYNSPSVLHFDVSEAGPGTFTAEVLGPQGKLPVHVNQTADRSEISFSAAYEGDHYIHLYWADTPLEFSPLLGYCAGPILPVDASKVVLTGQGAEVARATVQAEFIVDGRKAGPGKVRVEMKGVQSAPSVDYTPIKYDRYKCTYTPSYPGGFLLYVYWSDVLVPGCPHKVTVTAKGDVSKVKVTGEGLKGGIANNELRVFVDTKEAGPGEVTATCSSHRQGARVEVKQNEAHHYTLRILPTSADKHLLQVKYDGQHVPGSPFVLRIGEPPDASRVRVFGPGVEDGVLYSFESMFLVETHGAGAGQLAVRVRGPRGSFKVDMHRESQNERTIKCRYNPSEPGQYVVNVRWSGDHVPGSPFTVDIVEDQSQLHTLQERKGIDPVTNGTSWRAEI